jgi:putative transposase|nr:IS3 family transposase [uncultured Prevotella sp.]
MELGRKLPSNMSINRFCGQMHICRSRFYYEPKCESQANMNLMNQMDKILLEHPTTGVQKFVDIFRLRGLRVNHKRISRLMKVMGKECIYPQKCLSKGCRPKYVYPYLLRGTHAGCPNQIWSTDISYIAMEHGFMYLYAIIDVYSRFIVGWRLSNDLSASNCVTLLEECVSRHGVPEIINTDQGSQYTGGEWTSCLKAHHIRISMDGRGRCKDNIWIERFWRTIKQEYVYLNPADDGHQLRWGISKFMEYYNFHRPHHSLPELLPYKRYNAAA